MSACLCASTWGPYTQSVHRPGRTSYTTAAPKRSGGVFHVTTSVTRAPRDTAVNQYLERPWPEDAGPCLHTNTRWCRSPWRAAPGSFLTMGGKGGGSLARQSFTSVFDGCHAQGTSILEVGCIVQMNKAEIYFNPSYSPGGHYCTAASQRHC